MGPHPWLGEGDPKKRQWEVSLESDRSEARVAGAGQELSFHSERMRQESSEPRRTGFEGNRGGGSSQRKGNRDSDLPPHPEITCQR